MGMGRLATEAWRLVTKACTVLATDVWKVADFASTAACSAVARSAASSASFFIMSSRTWAQVRRALLLRGELHRPVRHLPVRWESVRLQWRLREGRVTRPLQQINIQPLHQMRGAQVTAQEFGHLDSMPAISIAAPSGSQAARTRARIF